MLTVIDNLNRLQDLESASRKKVPDKETEIAELRQSVPAPILAHYDRLRARDKKGVSAVRHQVCTECHMHVPIGVMATLMHGTDIQLCGNCGRYLFLSKEEAISTQSPAPAETKPKRRKKQPSEVAHAQ